VKELDDSRQSESTPESDDLSKEETQKVSAEQQQEVDAIEPVGLIKRKTSAASKESKK
jgi:hypothetical protein